MTTLFGSIIAASGKSNYVVAAANPIVREHVEGKPGEAEDGDDLSKFTRLDTHDELTILYGKVFLGVNLSCISCHDGAHTSRRSMSTSPRKAVRLLPAGRLSGKYAIHSACREVRSPDGPLRRG